MAKKKKTPINVKKACETCKKEFDVNYYKRNIQRFCSKTCSVNNPEVKEKNRQGVKNTFDTKYGCHPMKTEQGLNNLKNSIKKKYGVDWISKKDGWYNTVKQNNLIKYGVENYNNIEKAVQTRLSRSKDFNDEVYSRFKITRHKNHYDYLNNLFANNKLKMLCDFSDYKGYHFSHEYTFKCEKCNKVFESNVYKPNDVFCNVCNPEKNNSFEEQFYKFLIDVLPNEVVIKRRDRTILVGKELDFYIPEKNIAFELNGLYWHGENSKGLNKAYHLNKTKACACHGVRLIHIFENEWNYKPEIVKSVVNNLLNLTNKNTKIFARKCEVKEVDIKTKNKFLNDNHLQGEDKSTIKFGLYHKDELVSLMSFRKTSRFDKESDWELMRFCNKINTNIVGGASKLFSCFINNYQYKQIVSYSDRRYFDGEIYNTLGFKFTGYTPPNYYYVINNYKDLRHRMSFQKHKLSKILKEYNESLSEWENMKNNGYDRIWDCGTGKFIFTNPN